MDESHGSSIDHNYKKACLPFNSKYKPRYIVVLICCAVAFHLFCS